MKALISGIKRMEIHDGDGLRTTVFFKGCPLRCIWCHNPESISFHRQIAFFDQKCISCGTCASLCPSGAIEQTDGFPVIDRSRCSECFICAKNCPVGALEGFGEFWEMDDLLEYVLQDEPFFKSSGGGLTLSGGECLAQPAFAVQLARSLCEKGVSVDIDTCGYVKREVFEEILPYTDTFLYDIKAVDPLVHKACTGVTNELIVSNLRFLAERGARIEIRYPLVKGYNDGQCDRIGQLLRDIPGIERVKVLRYHRLAQSRYGALGLGCTLPDTVTGDEDLARAVGTLVKYGLDAFTDQ